MYITYEEYTALYDRIEKKTFNRLAYDACRSIDKLTTGIDGVKKLKVAFPQSEEDAEAVKRCAASVVQVLAKIQEAEQSASWVRGYVATPEGIRGKIVTSVSAGNESVNYSAGQSTEIDRAAFDKAVANKMIDAIIRDYLSGIKDANGVNLLYMGVYPRV